MKPVDPMHKTSLNGRSVFAEKKPSSKDQMLYYFGIQVRYIIDKKLAVEVNILFVLFTYNLTNSYHWFTVQQQLFLQFILQL